MPCRPATPSSCGPPAARSSAPGRSGPGASWPSSRRPSGGSRGGSGSRARGIVAVDVAAIGGITLRLETSDEFVRSRVRQAWLALGGLGALGLAVAAGLAGLQARRLAAPLDALARAADRLGAGDFSAT